MSIGIYKITCVANNRFYYGKCSYYRQRMNQHFSSLRKDTHKNIHMLADFKLYGEESFKVELIEVCSKEQLKEREDYYIEKYYDNNIMCYNIRSKSNHSVNPELTSRKLSESSKKMWENPEHREKMLPHIKELGLNNKGKVRSEENKELISQSSKEMWANNKDEMLTVVTNNLVKAHSEESRLKAQRSNKQVWNSYSPEEKEERISKNRGQKRSVEFKQNAANKSARTYLLLRDNKQIVITNLLNWAKENNCSYSSLKKLVQGKRKEYKGLINVSHN